MTLYLTVHTARMAHVVTQRAIRPFDFAGRDSRFAVRGSQSASPPVITRCHYGHYFLLSLFLFSSHVRSCSASRCRRSYPFALTHKTHKNTWKGARARQRESAAWPAWPAWRRATPSHTFTVSFTSYYSFSLSVLLLFVSSLPLRLFTLVSLLRSSIVRVSSYKL